MSALLLQVCCCIPELGQAGQTVVHYKSIPRRFACVRECVYDSNGSPWVICPQAHTIATCCDLFEVIGLKLTVLSNRQLILLASPAVCDVQSASTTTSLGPRRISFGQLSAQACGKTKIKRDMPAARSDKGTRLLPVDRRPLKLPEPSKLANNDSAVTCPFRRQQGQEYKVRNTLDRLGSTCILRVCAGKQVPLKSG